MSNDKMSDDEIAKGYSLTIHNQLSSVCETLNKAKNDHKMIINISIGPGADGRIEVQSVTVEKVTKLV